MTTDLLALPDLAQAIDREHQAAHEAARTALQHALECRRLLLQAKAAVAHGEWLPWLEANTNVGVRQSQTYMRLHRHRAEIEAANTNRDSHLPIRDAIALLAGPRIGVRTIFDELLEMGVKLRPTALELPPDLPFENWLRIGELLGQIERGDEDLEKWVTAQAVIYQYGERLIAALEMLEPLQAEIRDTYETKREWPPETEAVMHDTRRWIANAELWRRDCARYQLAMANRQLTDAVAAKMTAQHRVVLLADELQ